MRTTDNTDMPTISSTAMTATSGMLGASNAAEWVSRTHVRQPWQDSPNFEQLMEFGRLNQNDHTDDYNEEEDDMPNAKIVCRIVKVFIADPDEKLDLQDRLIHSGEEQLTDATDEELFFEIDPPVKTLLDKHNEKRKKTKDKKVKNKTAYLEPIRIKDLAMTVVTLAEFPAKA